MYDVSTWVGFVCHVSTWHWAVESTKIYQDCAANLSPNLISILLCPESGLITLQGISKIWVTRVLQISTEGFCIKQSTLSVGIQEASCDTRWVIRKLWETCKQYCIILLLRGRWGGGWSQINASIMAALVNVVWKKKSNPHQQFLQQEIE